MKSLQTNSTWHQTRPLYQEPLYSRRLIFLPFLITGHFFRASIAIHTCSRRHHLWEGWLGLVLLAYAFYFPGNIFKVLLLGTEHSGGLATITNIATVI